MNERKAVTWWNRVVRIPALLAEGLVVVYQWIISPVIHTLTGPGSGCRFHPTCSVYAREALRTHGFWRGGLLAVRRILKCHPWNPGGHDPVPPRRRSR